MQKVVTLRCPTCGAMYDFTVGGTAQLTDWHGIGERIADKREVERAREILRKAIGKRNKSILDNAAEVLGNIRYGDCGEETIKLLAEDVVETNERVFGEKVRESIASSTEKWAAQAQREGVEAYEAMYFCPKSRRIKQGLHFTVRLNEGKGVQPVYVYKNKCDDCSGHLLLVDDCNVGFMHEDMKTVARCKCGGQLVVDKVSFKQPLKEQEGGAQ